VNQSFEPEPKLSLYLSELVERINTINSESPLEFWEIELSGSYSDVLQFLREVRLSGMRTFPIQLQMTAAADGDHNWIIVFVI
jgi:hypothetical protein